MATGEFGAQMDLNWRLDGLPGAGKVLSAVAAVYDHPASEFNGFRRSETAATGDLRTDTLRI
jgi:hypothetical protein